MFRLQTDLNSLTSCHIKCQNRSLCQSNIQQTHTQNGEQHSYPDHFQKVSKKTQNLTNQIRRATANFFFWRFPPLTATGWSAAPLRTATTPARNTRNLPFALISGRRSLWQFSCGGSQTFFRTFQIFLQQLNTTVQGSDFGLGLQVEEEREIGIRMVLNLIWYENKPTSWKRNRSLNTINYWCPPNLVRTKPTKKTNQSKP